MNVMRCNLTFKANFIIPAMVAMIVFFTACDKGIEETSGDKDTGDEAIVYVINSEGEKGFTFVEFSNQGSANIFLGLSKNADSDVSATLKYDPQVLNVYNIAHETDYQLFPQELVTLEGDVAIAKGVDKSDEVEVKFKTTDNLKSDVTYVIPVSTRINSGKAKLPITGATYLLIFRKELNAVTACSKASGIKVISCMEINYTNPLNNLCFTLKESGKPLIDIVILFSANINYDETTRKVYVNNNSNLQHLLDNREKYIKPLQDRGMKVLLGLLGNHDRSGVANLSNATARAFAHEIKSVCDTYKLDGVLF